MYLADVIIVAREPGHSAVELLPEKVLEGAVYTLVVIVIRWLAVLLYHHLLLLDAHPGCRPCNNTKFDLKFP